MARTPKTMTLDLAHYSLQFSDRDAQKRADVKMMFGRGYDGITGTEVNDEAYRRLLRVLGHDAGYLVFAGLSNFVAVRRDLIVPGTARKFQKIFVHTDEVAGKGHHLHVSGVQLKTEGIGTWALLSSHYATRGRPDGPNINLADNKKLARGIGILADELGVGTNLVFYGGDQNIVDRNNDTFFGEDLTSAWDELKTWENTGNGNIDVIASHDRDRRVTAKYVRALDDREQFMFTDHYPVEAGFEVKLLRR